jgi:glutamate synthase (NADPH/NADH) large chain
MSGGIAYVYDPERSFKSNCNMEMIEFERLKKSDTEAISAIVFNHYKYTKSERAKYVLDNFRVESGCFVKVMPLEYKRILQAQEINKVASLAEVSDG